MSDEAPLPYNGTIHTTPTSIGGSEGVTEFFRLPVKATNELTFSVKAASGADLLFYDKDPTSDGAGYKVLVKIGSDGNSNASVGLKKADNNYQDALEGVKGILSANHLKTFTVRWYKGRVMLFNHGFDQPLISWDGPKELGFTNVGVRTVGSSGEWRVQGIPNFTTPDSNEYHDVEINTGRLDFELQSWHDCYVFLFPEAKRGDEVFLVIGGWDTTSNGDGMQSTWYINTEQGFHRKMPSIVNEGEYRKFWLKWDATNLQFGKAGSQAPVASVLNWGTPFKTFKYFGVKSVSGAHADWHILNAVGPHDVGKPSGGGQAQGGDAGQVGYVVVGYQYQQLQ